MQKARGGIQGEGAWTVKVDARAITSWLSAMNPSLPAGLLEWPCTLSIHVDGTTYRLQERHAPFLARPTMAKELAYGHWEAIEPLVLSRYKRWRQLLAVELIVAERDCLFIDKSVPIAAKARAAEIVSLEIQRLVPLPPGDVMSGFARQESSAAGQLLYSIAICKTRHIADLSKRLEALSINPTAVRIAGESGDIRAETLAMPGSNALASSGSHRLLLATLGTAACAFLTWAGGNAIDLYRKSQLIESSTEQVELLQRHAMAVKAKLAGESALIERAGSLRERKVREPSMTAIWEELTRLVPESAWLSELRVDDEVIQLDGFSSSAEELIPLLSTSPYLSGVEFASPVTRDPGKNVERFQIRMKLRKQQVASGSAPGAMK